MKTANTLLGCSVFALTVSISSIANAGLLVSGFTGGLTGTGFNSTMGYEFTIGSNDVNVTQLGYYDFGGNGLSSSHEVGIWTNTGTLVVSATVPNGTSAPLNSLWRMVDISATTLSANTTYTIGAQILGDTYSFGAGTPGSIDPALDSLGPSLGLFRNGSGLNFPNVISGTRLNANAFIEEVAPTSVPEPTSILGLLGVASLGALVSKGKKQA